MKAFTKKIVLEDGREFYGYGFGSDREAINEIVFNTSMVGYQEILSDPSYTGQMVVMTYPLIGNYGVTDEDFETRVPTMGGLIVREYNDIPSNFRYTKTVGEVLEENGIPGIQGVDTRALTRIIRSEGSQKVLLCEPYLSHDEAMAKLRKARLPRDQVARVSCKKLTVLFSAGSQHSCYLSAHVGPVSHYCDHILFLFDAPYRIGRYRPACVRGSRRQERHFPVRRRVRCPAPGFRADSRAGAVLFPVRLHLQAGRHGARHHRAHPHLLRVLRPGVPGAAPHQVC